MNAEDFIAQYNASIENSLEKDNLSLMDAFNPVDEDLFAFNDFEDVQPSNTVEKPITERKHDSYISSASVVIISNIQDNSNIEQVFFQDLEDDDYDIIYGDIVHTFNNAFNIKVDNVDEALCKYLAIYYGIFLSTEEMQRIKGLLNRELLEACSFPYRNIDYGEIELINSVINEEWFDITILHKYSLESKDTNMLINLMKDGAINYNALQKYSYNKDLLNAYLIMEYRKMYDADVFDSMCDNPQNLTAYVSSVFNGYFQKLDFLFKRPDYAQIYEILSDTPELGDQIIDSLYYNKDSLYLCQILKALLRGVDNQDFIDMYLQHQNFTSDGIDINTYLAEDFATYLNSDYLRLFKGNYHLSKCLTDMDLMKLDTEPVKLLLKSGDKLQKLNEYVINIISLYQKDYITELDYKLYLLLLSFQQNSSLIETVLGQPNIMSFNQFWISNLLEKIDYSADISELSGDLIILHISDDYSSDMIYSVEDLLCRVHTVIDSIATKVGNGFSISVQRDYIAFVKSGISSDLSNSNIVEYYKNTTNSLVNYVKNYKTIDVGKFDNIPAVLYILESNLFINLHNVSLNKSMNDFVLDVKKYLDYDRTIAIINSYKSLYVRAFNTQLGVLSIQLFNKIVNIMHNGRFQVNYLNMLFTCLFKNRYSRGFNVTDDNFIRLGDTLTITNIGIPGFTVCNISDILDKLDEYVFNISKLNGITMELADVYTIQVRGY